MGAGYSNSSLGKDDKKSIGNIGLGDLPESCLALVLSFLEPLEICRFACLSTTFRRASSADIVWESKLPQNYQILANRVLFFTDDDNDDDTSDSDIITRSKKEIFVRLCSPNRFDCDTKVRLTPACFFFFFLYVYSKLETWNAFEDCPACFHGRNFGFQNLEAKFVLQYLGKD